MHRHTDNTVADALLASCASSEMQGKVIVGTAAEAFRASWEMQIGKV
jgi:hypothetical protein